MVRTSNATSEAAEAVAMKDSAARVRQDADAAWVKENRAAIEERNKYVDEHGIPCAEFRRF